MSPSTGEILAEHPSASDAEVLGAAREAARVQRSWARLPVGRRVAPLRELGRLLRAESSRHAQLMAAEMGKPVAQGRAEAAKCASACDWYAESGPRFLASERVESDATRSSVELLPLGVVLAVMPWNFPYWQVIRFAAPALLAGNGAILKHASNVTGCSLELQSLFRRAGFPEGLFASVVASHDQVERLLQSSDVAALTLTGSTEAGRKLAPIAARALKKCVLELGGSDPAIVLEDADVADAAATCVSARLVNAGQSCIAAKRFVVVRDVLAPFTEAFVAGMASKRVGPPEDEATDVGPMARRDLRDALHEQVQRSVALGAKLLLGGVVPDAKGAWYPPTVLAGVKPGMPAFDEETFGPVAAIVEARDEADAIALANRTPFGLGASVYTRDSARGERIAREELQAGSCFVNGLVKSDPRLPFGGIKDSGWGRELSHHGLREFVNVKTVWVK